MAFYKTFCFFLSYLPTLIVAPSVAYPLAPIPREAICQEGYCFLVSGSFEFGEPLAGHMGPNAVHVDQKAMYNDDTYPAQTGNIIVYNSDDIPKLSSAILDTFIYRRNETQFVRYISSLDGNVGFMVVDRPVPDPKHMSRA